MYINNRAIEAFREKDTTNKFLPIVPSDGACSGAEEELRTCIHEHNVNVLDREGKC